MEYWVVYDIATGERRWAGSGPIGTASVQALPDGLALVVVPRAAIAGADVDLSVVRAELRAQVDAAAELVAGQYVTTGAAKVIAYQYKAAEAARLAAGDTGPTPFLTTEAAARGITVAALAAEVTAQIAVWVTIGAKIEAARNAAKAAIGSAGTISVIVAAAEVDWAAVLD